MVGVDALFVVFGVVGAPGDTPGEEDAISIIGEVFGDLLLLWGDWIY